MKLRSWFRGFTLLELMVSVVILLMGIGGALLSFTYCFLLNESNNNLVTAVNDAQYVMEEIRQVAYANISNYTAPSFTNLNNESISLNRSLGTEIGEVTVNVNWEERQRQRSFSLSARFAN
jgi:prepilin-type N-terminal cleavage/methylation domain-containing protein